MNAPGFSGPLASYAEVVETGAVVDFQVIDLRKLGELKMKLVSKPLVAAIALAAQIQPVMSDTITDVPVRTHPSQGEVTHIEGATARLVSSKEGVIVDLATSGLEPGHAYTLLMAVINKPGECPVLPCTPKDVLVRSDAVAADVAYAGGAIVGNDGAAHFSYYQPVGAFQKGFFERGLTGTEGVEIHLVINDHGPVIEGREFEMLTTYRGGCTDESLPPPMPASARDQGAPGPNSCRMVQFAQFIPEQPAS